MRVAERISSFQNPRIRAAKRLRDSRQRRREGLFLIDGEKEIAAAAESGIELESVFYATASPPPGVAAPCLQPVTEEVLAKLSYGQRADHPVAVARTINRSIAEFRITKTTRVLVLDHTEKPGNIGACLRTAAACGVDLVVLCNPICELFNPNTIRASRGAIFRLPVVESTREQLFHATEEVGLCILAARVQAPDTIWECDLRQGFVVVFGNETTGLGDEWVKPNVRPFKIPMHQSTDSLNLSISCAVTLYEAVRQRAVGANVSVEKA